MDKKKAEELIVKNVTAALRGKLSVGDVVTLIGYGPISGENAVVYKVLDSGFPGYQHGWRYLVTTDAEGRIVMGTNYAMKEPNPENEHTYLVEE